MAAAQRDEAEGAARANGWTVAAYAYGALVTAGIGYFLLRIPIQVSDSFGNIVEASRGTLFQLVYNEFYQPAFLRPLLWGTLRVVLDLSHGHYFAWFRGLHVAQIALLVVLFVRLVRPRTWSAAAAVPVGLAALIGIHTFTDTVTEAFPINTFLTILLCVFAAADLAIGKPRAWKDVAAAVLLAYAALTVESGLLVAVIFITAFVAGARGLSKWGFAAVLLLTVGYFFLRFVVLHVGAPGLEERSSGFGFRSYDPADLIRMFGGNPLPFYAYNVASSLLSLVLSEPRAGVWTVTAGLVHGNWTVGGIVNVVSSALGSAVIAAYVWRRRSHWRTWQLDRGDQLMAVFVVVALANAAISYAYTKDVILSPAGAFFAVAMCVAVADLLDRMSRATLLRGAAAAVMLLALSGTWAFREVRVHFALRVAAATTRNEWAYVDPWLEREGIASKDPLFVAIKTHLQDDAVVRHPAPPPMVGRWLDWFED